MAEGDVIAAAKKAGAGGARSAVRVHTLTALVRDLPTAFVEVDVCRQHVSAALLALRAAIAAAKQSRETLEAFRDVLNEKISDRLEVVADSMPSQIEIDDATKRAIDLTGQLGSQ